MPEQRITNTEKEIYVRNLCFVFEDVIVNCFHNSCAFGIVLNTFSVVFHANSSMLCTLMTSLRRLPRTARRYLSTTRSRSMEAKDAEKDFCPKKALLVRKVTRYEYEKFYLKPELSEAQLQEYVRL